MVVSSAVGRAMADQVKRTRSEPTPQEVNDSLRAQIAKLITDMAAVTARNKELRDENDTLRQASKWAKQPTPGKSFTFNGRPVVNQVEAARLLKVNQSQVSRWLKAGKLERADIPGKARPMIYADPLMRPLCKAGRPKKTT